MMSQVNTGQRLVYNHLVITSSEGKVSSPNWQVVPGGRWKIDY